MHPLADRHGRVATDLRVSLIDRCNLRCSYCMPAEGLDWLPNDELLTDDEVVRLVRIGVEQLGITAVRFTGGEPLLRKGLDHSPRRTNLPPPAPNASPTTQPPRLRPLAAALLDPRPHPGHVGPDTVLR